MLERRGFRPIGFTELVLKNWRELVNEIDTTIHLGDVILGENGTLGEILATIPGRKILVRGNHDLESNAWYERHGFHYVAQGILHGGVWLSHYPCINLPDGAVLNVHGHLHNNTHRGDAAILPAHCKLLAIENTEYKPVEFNEFVGFSPMRRLLLSTEDGASLDGNQFDLQSGS